MTASEEKTVLPPTAIALVFDPASNDNPFYLLTPAAWEGEAGEKDMTLGAQVVTECFLRLTDDEEWVEEMLDSFSDRIEWAREGDLRAEGKT